MPDPRVRCPACKIPIDQDFRSKRKTIHKLRKTEQYKSLSDEERSVLELEVRGAQEDSIEAYEIAIASWVKKLDSV